MTKLEKLYTSIKNLEELGLELTPEMLLECDKLEEQIIKDEILPALGQDIEPRLRQIQRPLVLVVEYTPEDPISVKLSRKMNIAEALGAKQITPPSRKTGQHVISAEPTPSPAPHKPTKQVVNNTKGLKVTFRDGTVIQERTANETMIRALQKIGLDKVATTGIQHGGGYGLVSKNKRPPEAGRIWQHKVEDWYVYVNISNQQKKDDLEKISKIFKLGLIVEDGKAE